VATAVKASAARRRQRPGVRLPGSPAGRAEPVPDSVNEVVEAFIVISPFESGADF